MKKLLASLVLFLTVLVAAISIAFAGISPPVIPLTVNASTITGTVAIANGGTNATSFTAPAGGIQPIPFFDGTRLTTDSAVSDLGYNPTTNTLYTPTLAIANAFTTTATFTNTGAQGPLGGSGMIGYADPGAAITSGSRLGFYLSGGAIDAAHTLVTPVGWGGFAAENFSATNQGSSFQVFTTPIGSTAVAGRRLVATFAADGSQTNVGSITTPGVIDGLASIRLSTTTTEAVESPERLNMYTLNNTATAGAAVGYTLPVAAAGKQRCYRQYTGKTGILTIATSAAGQYIDLAGVSTATGGNITSAGALGETACFVGVDATHWAAMGTAGVWTAH